MAQGIGITPTRYMLTSIGTTYGYRGAGYAQRVLNEVLADADAEGVTIILSVSPDPDTDKERLRAWYSRNGFVLIPEDEGHTAMQRLPREHEV
jgi:ribosomal protein S18 acetylase RimI-like enzyme